MLVLALDTSTRKGGVALARENVLLGSLAGDPDVTHGRRLPGDVLKLLARHGVSLREVELFAVNLGPGSFTGLRVGIATVQGLALVHSRPVVGVSSFDALFEHGVTSHRPSLRDGDLLGTWIDAQRGQVFAALFDPGGSDRRTGTAAAVIVEPPAVDAPDAIIAAWAVRSGSARVHLIGDGADRYTAVVGTTPASAAWQQFGAPETLAPAVAAVATARFASGQASTPHGLRPLYVRRPDAELARERRLPHVDR